MKENYIQKAIEKSIKGGYKPFKTIEVVSDCSWEMIDFQTLSYAHPGEEFGSARKNINQMFLDTLFWQCLGKSLGWGKTKEEKEMKGESLLSLWPEEWQVYWHRFIDHLAAGKDAESFFEDLLSNETKG